MSKCRRVFPGAYESLEEISRFVRAAAHKAGLNDTLAYSVEVSVDEACSNIIEHAYGGENIGYITLTCDVTPGELIIHIHDHGKQFNPASIKPPQLSADLSKHPGHGLGLYMMHKLMDEIFFEFDSVHGTTLTMIKRTEQTR